MLCKAAVTGSAGCPWLASVLILKRLGQHHIASLTE